jgi:hypothetical protein
MAQRKRPKKQTKAARAGAQEGSFVLGQRNAILLMVGILIIVIGYILLGKGSITAAPLLLVLGYCVVVPLSIILWIKRPEDKQKPDQTGTGE